MAYLLQIACITVLAEALLRLIPVRSAGFRYAYWRLVLVGALVMPWLLRTTVAPEEPTFVPIAPLSARPLESLPGMATTWGGAPWADLSWMAIAPWILVGGIVARAIWLGAGLARLRALRMAGEPVVDSAYDEIQQRLGTRASLRAVPVIAQPVTFGMRRPVVLLPATLHASPDSIRRAVVTHELVHVQRRDWLWVMAEEALRAALWFHPAIWWLTSRVRLTREEFTDHLAVLASGSRRQYMEALLAFADTTQLEPAPAFARRAHLFHRITLLSMEPVMSTRRVLFSGALVTMLLATGGWFVTEAFPVIVEAEPAAPSPAQAPAAGQVRPETLKPITPENPIPRRQFATPIPYPLELNGTGFLGVVQLRVVVGANGAVTDVASGAAAVSDPRPGVGTTGTQAMDTFSAAAADSVRRWQYDPPASAPIFFYVGVTFKPGAEATVSQYAEPRGVTARVDGVRLLNPGEFNIASPGAAAGAGVGRRGGGAGAPRPVAPASPATSAGPGGSPADLRAERTITVTPSSAAAAQPGSVAAPIRIGGAMRPPIQTRKVNPVYPPLAEAARVSGVVILEVVIDEQGNVRNPRVLRSIPLLDQAALDAVSQWQYEPVLLNGAPVPVIMTVTVQFSPQF